MYFLGSNDMKTRQNNKNPLAYELLMTFLVYVERLWNKMRFNRKNDYIEPQSKLKSDFIDDVITKRI